MAVPSHMESVPDQDRERCACGCGARWTTTAWNQLRPAGVWTTEDGALQLRVCTCGSTISASFSHASSTLTAAPPATHTTEPSSPVEAGPDTANPLFFCVGGDRFQAWCACMRKSPVVAGTREEVEGALGQLHWHSVAGTWTCPVCVNRARRTLIRRDSGAVLRTAGG